MRNYLFGTSKDTNPFVLVALTLTFTLAALGLGSLANFLKHTYQVHQRNVDARKEFDNLIDLSVKKVEQFTPQDAAFCTDGKDVVVTGSYLAGLDDIEERHFKVIWNDGIITQVTVDGIDFQVHTRTE